MATYREERNARQDYICACCGMVIPAGTQYVRITQHNTKRVPIKHSNIVKTYHIECAQ